MADKVMAFYHSFQSAAVATGTGTAMDVGGLPAVGVQITGISGDTITFQGTLDGTNWVAVQAVNLNDGSVGTTTTANGLYLVPVSGLDKLYCNITAWVSGTITVVGKGVVNAAGVTLADIDIAGAEASTIADGADVAQGTTTDAAASSTVAETTTARTGIGLWKGIKNILVLLNAKFVTGTVIGDVNVTTIAAGETHVGEVHANSIQVDVPLTITAGLYTVGDVIGGIQTIGNAARVSGKQTTLDTLVITDLAMQDADIKVWFFNENPANGTYTDNGALAIHDTDLVFCIGVVRVLSSDYDDATDNSVATLRNIGLKLTPAATSLFAIAEIETADTYATTGDLVCKYSFSRD